ncbi:MAG: laccase domain-containing protein, partial [Bacillota bacterium]|nr:laccase domain-containing protein [Bacillota bacterium]
MINDYLCKKENIHAIIGPCIGVCHFEVGTDVMIEFKNTGLNKCIKKGEKPDKYYIDLKEANKEYLLRAGVSEKNITVSGECTCCDTRKYFSHRACGADTGRMAVIAQLR